MEDLWEELRAAIKSDWDMGEAISWTAEIAQKLLDEHDKEQ